MTGALVLLVFGLSAGAPAADTVLTVPAPEAGVIRMTYGAPRMNVVPGFRRTEVSARAGAPAVSASTALSADELDPLVVDRLERLINRRFDRLEAMTGVPGRGVGAFLQFFDGAQGPALLVQPEGRLDVPPDTVYLAENVLPEQIARLTAPPTPVRPPPPDMPRATIQEPGAPIMIDRRELQEELFPMVRLNFEFAGANVLDYADPTLDAIGSLLEDHPDIRLEIAGHTDNVGSASFNLDLSQQRADAVREYLLAQFDVDPGRLVAIGYGLTRPLTTNRTETERAVNRRVEFAIIEQDPETATDENEVVIDDEELRETLREAVQDAIRESLQIRDEREVEW